MYKWKYETPEGFSYIWMRSDGSLTGYSGGMENKQAFLELEKK